MHYYELDKEEQAQLDDIESGTVKSVKNLQEVSKRLYVPQSVR